MIWPTCPASRHPCPPAHPCLPLPAAPLARPTCTPWDRPSPPLSCAWRCGGAAGWLPAAATGLSGPAWQHHASHPPAVFLCCGLKSQIVGVVCGHVDLGCLAPCVYTIMRSAVRGLGLDPSPPAAGTRRCETLDARDLERPPTALSAGLSAAGQCSAGWLAHSPCLTCSASGCVGWLRLAAFASAALRVAAAVRHRPSLTEHALPARLLLI